MTSNLHTLTADDSRTAGFHRDATGALIVNLTDAALADRVSRSGATPRIVARSTRALNHADVAWEWVRRLGDRRRREPCQRKLTATPRQRKLTA